MQSAGTETLGLLGAGRQCDGRRSSGSQRGSGALPGPLTRWADSAFRESVSVCSGRSWWGGCGWLAGFGTAPQAGCASRDVAHGHVAGTTQGDV
jgi:hypothetical protein